MVYCSLVQKEEKLRAANGTFQELDSNLIR